MATNAGTFDYVLVGGGSAGSVLATRLSANGVFDVCVLERGCSAEKYTEKDWMLRRPWSWFAAAVGVSAPFILPYYTVPQKHANNRRIYTPRGTVLGGTGALNGANWVRGDPRDYDRWASENGCPGWSFKDCLPFFKRLETYESGISMNAASLPGGLDEVIEKDKAYGREINRYRGDSGPIRTFSGRISYAEYSHQPMSPAIMRAAMQAGFQYCPDHNGPDFEGVSWMDNNLRDGTRDHAGQAFLAPAKERQNLHIIEKALASKIQFETKGNEIRAVGVEYMDVGTGEKKVVYAKEEVILCGGTYNSPQLLMLSGVGDAEHLKELGIHVVHHLPGVGNNLQDHPGVIVTFHTKRPELGFPIGDWSDSNEFANKARKEWETTKKCKAGCTQMEPVVFAKLAQIGRAHV